MSQYAKISRDKISAYKVFILRAEEAQLTAQAVCLTALADRSQLHLGLETVQGYRLRALGPSVDGTGVVLSMAWETEHGINELQVARVESCHHCLRPLIFDSQATVFTCWAPNTPRCSVLIFTIGVGVKHRNVMQLDK